MRRISLIVTVLAVIWAFPSSAYATHATCPDPALGTTAGTDNQYTVDPALDCVYDDGNIGGSNDAFLNGDGIEEDSYGDATTAGPTFGKTWTNICDALGSCSGTGGSLTITNLTGDSANWAVAGTFDFFALGIKDGTGPKWAVFLLDSSDLSGVMSMVGGSFSHFVLYGSGGTTDQPTDQPVTPEPSTLLLFGSGLAIAATRLRRRKAQI